MIEFATRIGELKQVIRCEYEKTVLYRLVVVVVEWLAKRLGN